MPPTSYFEDILPHNDEAGPGRKKRRTAARIFLSAFELMQDEGFDGVSVEQICERAGIARATFFQHYASKGELLSTFAGIVCHKLDEELAPAELKPLERLRLVANHFQRMIDDLGAFAPDLLAASAAGTRNRLQMEDPSAGVIQRITAIIEAGQADGSLTGDWQAQDIAISIVAAWIGMSSRSLAANKRSPDLQSALDLILTGAAPRK